MLYFITLTKKSKFTNPVIIFFLDVTNSVIFLVNRPSVVIPDNFLYTAENTGRKQTKILWSGGRLR